MSPLPLPRVLSPPQPVSTFPPLHIPLLTETRSPSSSFPRLPPITPSLALVLSTSVCYIDILSLPPYRDTPLTVPPVTLSMTTDLRGKCKVPPHQEIKTLASSRCLTPLTSLVFPHPFLHIPLPKSPLYHLLFCFLFPPFSHLSQHSPFPCPIIFSRTKMLFSKLSASSQRLNVGASLSRTMYVQSLTLDGCFHIRCSKFVCQYWKTWF